MPFSHNCRIWAIVLFVAYITAFGQNARAQVSGTTSEPPPPQSSPTVSSILNGVDKALVNKQYSQSLAVADAAIKAAGSGGDVTGEAQAHRIRALSLVGLGRLQEAREESRLALNLSAANGDGIGQVKAILIDWSMQLMAPAQLFILVRRQQRSVFCRKLQAHVFFTLLATDFWTIPNR